MSVESQASSNDSRVGGARGRVLVVFPANSYRVEAYHAAAARVGVGLALATDLPVLFRAFGHPVLGVDFGAPEKSACILAAAARTLDVRGVVGTNEASAIVASLVAAELGLPHSSPEAAYVARDKRRMRETLRAAGFVAPGYRILDPEDTPEEIAERGDVRFPCVVKPPMLTGSQGVIRADDDAALFAAIVRVRAILARHPSEAGSTRAFHRLLVEDYLPGPEVSVEAIMSGGVLEPIAIFDKPDSLTGPYFEETIYLTPSRLSGAAQRAILETTAEAARALGLTHGPIHAELRVGSVEADGSPHRRSPPAIVEIAARSIGGLCSRVVEHVTGSLEELILLHAISAPHATALRADREGGGGVMMIPIPRSGVLRQVHGLDAARAVPGIDDVTITLRPGDAIRTLPEGGTYLGFIFARGASPDQVEHSLREAHAALRFELAPLLDISP